MRRGFLQVLGRAPWFMAGRLAHAQAVGLVVLFLLGSWGSVVEPIRPVAEILESENNVLRAGPGDEMNLTLTTNPTPCSSWICRMVNLWSVPNSTFHLEFCRPSQDLFGTAPATGTTPTRCPTAQAFPLTPGLSPGHRPVSCGISTPITKVGRSQIPTRPESRHLRAATTDLRAVRFAPMLAQPTGLPRLSTWLEAPMFRSTLGCTRVARAAVRPLTVARTSNFSTRPPLGDGPCSKPSAVAVPKPPTLNS